jgi:hypothetical protein
MNLSRGVTRNIELCCVVDIAKEEAPDVDARASSLFRRGEMMTAG